MSDIPRGNAAGLTRWLKHDLQSGFFVFLIALPLCLGISIASGFPPIAGVFTAIVGAVLTTLMSDSELTIKGPAAGLIVIVVGTVTAFGYTGGQNPEADLAAYRMALGVGCAAAVLQILFGRLKAGILGDFFPTAAVHGMLAAIGIIIVIKQLPIVFGQTAKGEPFHILAQLPEKFMNMNPEIAVIGFTSLIILFGLPALKSVLKQKWLDPIPAQLLVVLVSIPMGMYFDLSHEHTYSFFHKEYLLGEKFLVNVPGSLLRAVAHPDFSAFTTPALLPAALKWTLMFALIGSLESLLSAKAIDMIDPYKRKTDLNRDLTAVGVANLVAASIGGLPMISEIVRSKANIDNGARTRFADLWHGVFLLSFVALVPGLIHRIPLAALAAMLVYTGFRLASPHEFVHAYKVGREQLAIFVTTIVAVLATDLLVGIGIGIALKFVIHMINGVKPAAFVKPHLEIKAVGDKVHIHARESAVFTNWIPFKRRIEEEGLTARKSVVVNLANTVLVDHSVMERLHQLGDDFKQAGLELEVVGLEKHEPLADHPHSARRRKEAA